MLKHLSPIAATAIVLLFLLASSVPLMHWFDREGREARLADGEALWRSHGIDNYDFAIRIVDARPPASAADIRVTVRNGRAVQLLGGEDLLDGGADSAAVPATIPDLFAAVRSNIDADPDSIEVVYDIDYGFPRLLKVDPIKAYDDDEFSLKIDDFRLIRRESN